MGPSDRPSRDKPDEPTSPTSPAGLGRRCAAPRRRVLLAGESASAGDGRALGVLRADYA